MDTERKLKMLQLLYAGALADAALRMNKEKILEKVTSEKRIEQLDSGKVKAQQLGITTPEQVFGMLTEIFGCSAWNLTKTTSGFKAEATNCMLCALSKKIGAGSPCNIYCLDPMEGLVKGVAPNSEYKVESTLWDDNKCLISVIK